ncbi:MAG: response regulator, partial [Verrucomicrobiae bacterium]|nr:response regulator [Verrucomicrobiae bacterium]
EVTTPTTRFLKSEPREPEPSSDSPFERIRQSPVSLPAGSRKLPNSGVQHRVLLVEDNVVNQKVARLTLERLGFKVDLAENGAMAVDMAAINDYELICMDVQMPVLDGREATRRIRALDGPSSSARVLAMTGHAFREDRDECFRAGMDDFISKPFDLFELKEKLDRLLTSSDGESPPSAAIDALALSS